MRIKIATAIPGDPVVTLIKTNLLVACSEILKSHRYFAFVEIVMIKIIYDDANLVGSGLFKNLWILFRPFRTMK